MSLTVFYGFREVEVYRVFGPTSSPVLHEVLPVVKRLLAVPLRRAVRLPHPLLLPVAVHPAQIYSATLRELLLYI